MSNEIPTYNRNMHKSTRESTKTLDLTVKRLKQRRQADKVGVLMLREGENCKIYFRKTLNVFCYFSKERRLETNKRSGNNVLQLCRRFLIV